MTYGQRIGRPPYPDWAPRGVLGDVETAPSGNVVLRAGVENESEPGWHQTAHIVLTPDEAVELAAALIEAPPNRAETRSTIRRIFAWVYGP